MKKEKDFEQDKKQDQMLVGMKKNLQDMNRAMKKKME
jgi:hypothetical protein